MSPGRSIAPALVALLLSTRGLAAAAPRPEFSSLPAPPAEPPSSRSARSLTVAGGIVVVWRLGQDHLTAQKWDTTGAPLWGPTGVAVSEGSVNTWQATSDDAGGVIVAWSELRGSTLNIYAQRIDAAGAPLWTVDGAAVSTNVAVHDWPALAPDGSGGAVIAWEQRSIGPPLNKDIYAQRVNAVGQPLWTQDGVPVTVAVRNQTQPAVIPSGAGGAVVSWYDYRSGTSTDLYAQRLSDQGARLWTTDDVPVCVASGFQSELAMVPDLTSGAILVWRDEGSSVEQIFAQRVSGDGNATWTPNGKQISGGFGDQINPAIVADGAGGAVIAWFDGGSGEAYAQRVNNAGEEQWPEAVGACPSDGAGLPPEIYADGSGGAFLGWWSYHPDSYDVFAQHISGAGSATWGSFCVPVCTAYGTQSTPIIAGDGAGGVIMAWFDERAGDWDLYGQRFNGAGAPQWAANGIPLYVNPGQQRHPGVVADASGGEILVWQEKRNCNYDIRATRVDASNVTLWPPVTVCGAANRQFEPIAVSDSAGGMIVVWQDERNEYERGQLYAQRLAPTGTALWAPGGVPVTPGSVLPLDPIAVAPDRSGGVIVLWEDIRTGYPVDLYAQRVTGVGQVVWGDYGLLVCPHGMLPAAPMIASDGGNGAFVGWTDHRAGNNDVYAQHVSAAGVALWSANGIPVCSNGADQGLGSIVPDGAGGAILGWADYRSGTATAYAQRVDGGGNPVWPGDGVQLCTNAASESDVHLVPDGAGGAISVWHDRRAPGGEYDIYGQRIDSGGNLLWADAGVPVCAAGANQFLSTLVSDGAKGAIAVWGDNRPVGPGLYAQRMGSDGNARWATDGVLVSPDLVQFPSAASDGAGGLFAAWQARPDASGDLVYSQRLTGSGDIAPGWPGNGAVPVLISLVSAKEENGRARLAWQLEGGGEVATIYRATTPGTWAALASVRPDGSGRVIYEDATVVPGMRYGYRLGTRDGAAEVLGGEVWVDVSERPAFALWGASPNPALREGLRVRFTLPDGAPARLDALDVEGRRVTGLEVGVLGAGSHTVLLGPARGLAPGIYLLRLSRAGRTLGARAVVLR